MSNRPVLLSLMVSGPKNLKSPPFQNSQAQFHWTYEDVCKRTPGSRADVEGKGREGRKVVVIMSGTSRRRDCLYMMKLGILLMLYACASGYFVTYLDPYMKSMTTFALDFTSETWIYQVDIRLRFAS
ncbi:hypothetical protein CPC08DRAFT_102625 [Agrocybe pediades]|nr:hypothetical protein CPC08DRAFT_102625 [Agrocybe pediades]